MKDFLPINVQFNSSIFILTKGALRGCSHAPGNQLIDIMIYPEHTLHIQWVKCLLNLAAEINIREVSEKERVLQLGLNPLDLSNINIKQIEMYMKQIVETGELSMKIVLQKSIPHGSHRSENQSCLPDL